MKKKNNSKKIGIIGYGNWGRIVANKFTLLVPYWEYSLIINDKKNTINRGSGTEFCSQLDDFLKNKEIIGVIICTPAPTHYDIIWKSLHAGKHILVNEPISLNYDDCLELVNLAKNKGLYLIVNSFRRYDHNVRNLPIHFGLKSKSKFAYCEISRISNENIVTSDPVQEYLTEDISLVDYVFNIDKITYCNGRFTSSNKNSININVVCSSPVCDNLELTFRYNCLSPYKYNYLEIGLDESIIRYDLDKSNSLEIYTKIKEHNQFMETKYNVQIIDRLSAALVDFINLISDKNDLTSKSSLYSHYDLCLKNVQFYTYITNSINYSILK